MNTKSAEGEDAGVRRMVRRRRSPLWTRRPALSAALVVVALVAAGCGGGSDGADTGAADVNQLPLVSTTSDVSATPEADPSSPAAAARSLSVALSDMTSASSYRIELSSAQVISSTALGLDIASTIDPDNPVSVSEVTPEGVHARIDIAAALGQLATGAEALVVEMWVTDDLIVMDTTSYSSLVRADPSVDLGPFRPGVFSFDPARWEVLDEYDVVAALGGDTIDLATLGRELPAVIREVEQSGDSPVVYRGVASWADLNRAQGTDVGDVARGMSAGIGLMSAIDAGVLADIYVDFFEEVQADVVVTVGADGLVDSIRYFVDMSGLYTSLFSSSEMQRAMGASDVEMASVRDAFVGTEWTIENLVRFFPDPDLMLEPPPVATEDRTEEFLAFMLDSGAFDG